MEWSFFSADFDPDLYGLADGGRPRSDRCNWFHGLLPPVYTSSDEDDVGEYDEHGRSRRRSPLRHRCSRPSMRRRVYIDSSDDDDCVASSDDAGEWCDPTQSEREQRFQSRIRDVRRHAFWERRREAWCRAAHAGVCLRTRVRRFDDLANRLLDDNARLAIDRVLQEQRRRQTEGDFAVELPYEFRKEASRAQRAAMARVQYDNNLLLHVRVVAPNDQDDLVQRSLLRDVSAEMSAYARLLRLRGYSQTKIDHALETMYDDDDERLVDEDSLQQLKIEEILAGRRRCYSSASSSDSSMGSF